MLVFCLVIDKQVYAVLHDSIRAALSPVNVSSLGERRCFLGFLPTPNCDVRLIGYRLEDRPYRIREESGTSKCIRNLVVVVVVRAAAAARYMYRRHAKSTYMDSYIFFFLKVLIHVPKTPPCVEAQ